MLCHVGDGRLALHTGELRLRRAGRCRKSGRRRPVGGVLRGAMASLLAKLAHSIAHGYFATSPGAQIPFAIITDGSTVDVPLVMSIPEGRAIAVMCFRSASYIRRAAGGA